MIFNELSEKESGGVGAWFGPCSTLGAEIPVQGVDGRVQNKFAVGTGFQMTFDLTLDGCGQSAL
jgi:hypothetical protein